MAATFELYEDNGAPVGSPAKGTTRTLVTRIDWKAVDDTTTGFQEASIRAGERSYVKNNFMKFSGTFNKIFNVKFAHTAGVLGTGVSLVGLASSVYSQTTDQLMGTDISAPIAPESGMALELSTVGPEGTSSAELTAPGYSQYFKTQLQTTTSAQPGDTTELTLKVIWDEN